MKPSLVSTPEAGMRLRHVLATLVALVSGGCAVASMLAGPGGVAYALLVDSRLAMKLPLPENWVANWVTEPVSAFVAKNPAGTSSLTIMMDPTEVSPRKMLAEVDRILGESSGKTGARDSVTGTVNGRAANGFQAHSGEHTATVFVVDHDRAIYMIIMDAATNADQEILDFIFARIRFTE